MVGYEKPENITFRKCYVQRSIISHYTAKCVPALDAEVITFHVDRLDKTLPNDVYRDRITYQHMNEM